MYYYVCPSSPNARWGRRCSWPSSPSKPMRGAAPQMVAPSAAAAATGGARQQKQTPKKLVYLKTKGAYDAHVKNDKTTVVCFTAVRLHPLSTRNTRNAPLVFPPLLCLSPMRILYSPQNSLSLITDFHCFISQSWCGPCQRLKPHFASLASKCSEEATEFFLVDVDANSAAKREAQVSVYIGYTCFFDRE